MADPIHLANYFVTNALFVAGNTRAVTPGESPVGVQYIEPLPDGCRNNIDLPSIPSFARRGNDWVGTRTAPTQPSHHRPLWSTILPCIATLGAAIVLLPVSTLPITLSFGLGLLLSVRNGKDGTEGDINHLNERHIFDISIKIRRTTDPEERTQNLQLLHRIVNEHRNSVIRRSALERLVFCYQKLKSMDKIFELIPKFVDLAMEAPDLETAEFATMMLAELVVATEQSLIIQTCLKGLETIGIRSKGTEKEELVYRALDFINNQLGNDDDKQVVSTRQGIRREFGYEVHEHIPPQSSSKDMRTSWAAMMRVSVQNALVITNIEDVTTCLDLALGSDDTKATRAHRAFLSWGFRDPDPNVVEASIMAIGHLVENAPNRITAETVTALYHVGRVHILHSPIAKAVALVLGKIAEIIPSEITSEVIEILLKIGLQNKDPEVIATAAQALGLIVINAKETIAGASQALHIGAQNENPIIAREFDRVRQELNLQVPERVDDPTLTDVPLAEESPPQTSKTILRGSGHIDDPKSIDVPPKEETLDPRAESPPQPAKTIMGLPEKKKPD